MHIPDDGKVLVKSGSRFAVVTCLTTLRYLNDRVVVITETMSAEVAHVALPASTESSLDTISTTFSPGMAAAALIPAAWAAV
jgi:hypothetical protein